MKFKKIWFPLLASSSIIAPTILAVSCGNTSSSLEEYSNKIQNIDFKEHSQTFDMTQFKTWESFDAMIVEWRDGDTPVVKFKPIIVDGESKFPVHNQEQWSIRVNSIDTPELHYQASKDNWVKTTGAELKWATKAKEFGEQEMPVGSEIKVLTDKTPTYSRITGALFYKPINGKYKDYSVEILRNGLALPFFNNDVPEYNLIDGGLINVTGIALADAYNTAVQKKTGLFGEDLNSILKTHGETSDTRIRYRVGERKAGDEPNIYEYANVSYGKVE